MISPGSIHTNSFIWIYQVAFIYLEIFTHMPKLIHTYTQTNNEKGHEFENEKR